MVRNIRSECAEERRRSMEFCTVEGKRHAAVLVELKNVAREREAESIRLKLADEKYAKAYKREIEEERRRSLQFRNEEGVRHRHLDEEMRHMEMNECAENEALTSACKYLLLILYSLQMYIDIKNAMISMLG